MKKYTAWLKTAAIFQILNALMHVPSLFFSPPPNNDTEKQLFTLMDTYRFNFGAGFEHTMTEMTLVFSACLSLLCLLGGLLNWYLLSKKTEPEIMKGVVTINLFVFGILFILTVAFTFLIPVISIGLISVFLLLARVSIARVK